MHHCSHLVMPFATRSVRNSIINDHSCDNRQWGQYRCSSLYIRSLLDADSVRAHRGRHSIPFFTTSMTSLSLVSIDEFWLGSVQLHSKRYECVSLVLFNFLFAWSPTWLVSSLACESSKVDIYFFYYKPNRTNGLLKSVHTRHTIVMAHHFR